MRRLRHLVGIVAIAAGVSTLPALAVGVSATSTLVHPVVASRAQPQKGIAINIDNANRLTDAKAMSIANALFSMVRSKLHANAVSFNFPLWQSSSKSNDPRAASMTPSPGRLAALTEIAHRYHLSVEYRPYLYEGDLAGLARALIHPSNPATWFANYWAFLQPYLESASEAGATSFGVALEFYSLMPYLSDWYRIVQQAKAIFPGVLLYSQGYFGQGSIPLTRAGFDAYQPISLGSDRAVSVAAFTKGFVRNLQVKGMESAAADIWIEEVGIAAVSGAYKRPDFYHYPAKTKVDRVIQTDWFAGACNAFWSLHLKAIYFWAIDFTSYVPGENFSKDIYNWLGTPTATVVAKCYARTK
jgi:hypothetical protein